MKINRHKVDEELARELFDNSVKRLPSFVEGAKRDAKNLSLLATIARRAVASGCVVEPESPQIPIALKLAAQAHVALFAAASASSQPVTVRLGEGEPATYTSPPDESTVHVGAWLTGYYLNVLCRDLGAIETLCRTPIESLRGSTTKGPEYLELYAKSLQIFSSGTTEGLVDTMLAAMKATDPKRPDVSDADWSLYLHVPQLEVLIYAVTKDAKFGEALRKAVENHKKYWGRTETRRRDDHGYISIELTALAALGHMRGLAFDVESEYLPMYLVQG